jgi:hypothetical protein
MKQVILIGTLGRPLEKKAATPGGVAAKVTMDRHAPRRDSGIVEAGGASNPSAFSGAKAFATSRAAATPDSRAMHCARAFARAMLKGDMALAWAYQRALWRVAQNPARFSLAEGCT